MRSFHSSSLKPPELHCKVMSTCNALFRSTKITASQFLSTTKPNSSTSSVIFSLNPSVLTRSIHYPAFSWPDFFADLGGSAGLWLGLGIVQILELVMQIVRNCCKREK